MIKVLRSTPLKFRQNNKNSPEVQESPPREKKKKSNEQNTEHQAVKKKKMNVLQKEVCCVFAVL